MGLRKPTQIGFIPNKKVVNIPNAEEVAAEVVAPEGKEKELTKKEVIAILKEKGIAFDEKAKVGDLKALIPVDEE